MFSTRSFSFLVSLEDKIFFELVQLAQHVDYAGKRFFGKTEQFVKLLASNSGQAQYFPMMGTALAANQGWVHSQLIFLDILISPFSMAE